MRRRPGSRSPWFLETVVSAHRSVGENQPAALTSTMVSIVSLRNRLATDPSPSSPVRSRYSQAIWSRLLKQLGYGSVHEPKTNQEPARSISPDHSHTFAPFDHHRLRVEDHVAYSMRLGRFHHGDGETGIPPFALNWTVCRSDPTDRVLQGSQPYSSLAISRQSAIGAHRAIGRRGSQPRAKSATPTNKTRSYVGRTGTNPSPPLSTSVSQPREHVLSRRSSAAGPPNHG